MFDPKCYELAEHFLPNASENRKRLLAQEIQSIIEDFEVLPQCEQCGSERVTVQGDGAVVCDDCGHENTAEGN